MSLKLILEQKKCFKLICGAGNQNLDEIEKLVALYSASGCHFFDFAADEKVLAAAQRGLDFSIPKNEQKDYHFCISIGTKNDQHVQKAKIIGDKCKKCGVCIGLCPQNAIDKDFKVVEDYCIGCFRCKVGCKFLAIDGYSKTLRHPELCEGSLLYKVLRQKLPQDYNLSCIELHASDANEQEVDEVWDALNKNFEGRLSLCLGREKLSNERIFARVKRLVEKREPYSVIIQADGSPMSGGGDDFNTTLQAVAMADLIKKSELPIYLLMSGGTNSKTAELAKLCGVDFNGVAIGSYARKIVKNYIERDDFLTNKAIFEEASKIAQNLIFSL